MKRFFYASLFARGIFLYALTFCSNSFAQNDISPPPLSKPDSLSSESITTMLPPALPSSGLALGINSGVSGLGIDVTYRFHQRLSIQTGYNYAAFNVKNYKAVINGQFEDLNLLLNGGFDMSSVPVMLHFNLTKKGGIRLVGGANYLLQAKNIFHFKASLADAITTNSILITPSDFGSASFTLGYKSAIAPYLGLGFGKIIPKRRVNLTFDLGAYYRGNYAVGATIEEGVLSKENVNNATLLERNLNAQPSLKFFPQANLRLAFKIF